MTASGPAPLRSSALDAALGQFRRIEQAIFAGSDQLQQLWLFWVAPIIGGVIGAVVYRALLGDQEDVEYA